MGYTVWQNSFTVAYKTRPVLCSSANGPVIASRESGRIDEYTEERGYWFESEAVVVGLTAAQARDVRLALERATELSPIAGDDVKAVARRLAISRKEDVRVDLFWVTLDGVTSEEAERKENHALTTYGEPERQKAIDANGGDPLIDNGDGSFTCLLPLRQLGEGKR
jgi:CRISPR/Cas system CMR subunit Cmr6 (Cas7 group RAMP superfamily)